MSTSTPLTTMVNTEADALLGASVQGFVRAQAGAPVLATPAAVAVGYAAVVGYAAPAAAFTAGATSVVGAYALGQAVG